MSNTSNGSIETLELTASDRTASDDSRTPVDAYLYGVVPENVRETTAVVGHIATDGHERRQSKR